MPFEKLTFRNLNKDEIEVRRGSANTLLLYKTARVDANILDETVGPFNWQKKFYQVKNTMICSVGINVNYNDPTKPPLFIWKDDAGDDDYTTEKVKAEASDSFKRAGFAWGIGRTNLYFGPKIKLDDKYKDKQFFECDKIEYDSKGIITDLVISTDFGKTIVFLFKNGRKVAQNVQDTPKNEQAKGFTKQDEEQIAFFQGFNTAKGSIAEDDKKFLLAYLETATDTESKKLFGYMDKNYNTMSVEQLSELQGKDLVGMFKNRGK